MKNNQMSQLLSILLLLLIVVGAMIFVFPMRQDIVALQSEYDAASMELQAAQADYDALVQLSDDVAKSEATKEALALAVPEGAAQDELILELSEMAEDAGFELSALSFSQAIRQNYGNTLTVNASLSGGYDQLIEFLQALEGAERLLQVSSLSVQLTSTDSIVFNLNIEAYYQ